EAVRPGADHDDVRHRAGVLPLYVCGPPSSASRTTALTANPATRASGQQSSARRGVRRAQRPRVRYAAQKARPEARLTPSLLVRSSWLAGTKNAQPATSVVIIAAITRSIAPRPPRPGQAIATSAGLIASTIPHATSIAQLAIVKALSSAVSCPCSSVNVSGWSRNQAQKAH